MSDLLPCPFGDYEHFPDVVTDEMDEEIDGNKWAALAICDDHDGFCLHGFGKTKDEALSDLAERWNTRYERTCRLNCSGLVCNVCGYELSWVDFPENSPNYCPGCGAKVVHG